MIDRTVFPEKLEKHFVCVSLHLWELIAQQMKSLLNKNMHFFNYQ